MTNKILGVAVSIKRPSLSFIGWLVVVIISWPLIHVTRWTIRIGVVLVIVRMPHVRGRRGRRKRRTT